MKTFNNFYKLIICTILLMVLSGCTLVNSIERFADSVDYSNNVNNQTSKDFKNYINDLNESQNNLSIPAKVFNLKKESLKSSIYTLELMDSYNASRIDSTSAYKNILSTKRTINEYLDTAKKYNCKKEIDEATDALKNISEAEINLQKKKYEYAKSDIKLAILYLANDKNAIWQFQKDNAHLFPKYLKWGDNSENTVHNIVSNPNSLVFSGGGAKGTAYAGTLKYFQETGKLKNVKRFIGTSAGSIMCTFMSVSAYYETHRKPNTPHAWELVYSIMEENDFIDFIENPILKKAIEQNNFAPFSKHIITTVPSLAEDIHNQYALCSGEKILNFFKESLSKFGFNKNVTLGELHKITGINLILVASSLSYQKAAYFNYITAPEMPVVLAMRASMAIPFIFKPVKYNNDFFVDGGTVNNYPIDYFDNYGTENGETPLTLGFILYTKTKCFTQNGKKLKIQ